MNSPIRILLVEDNPINQKVALALLKSSGCTVSTADNGSQALDQIRQTPFDLILMDIQMPVMDGLSAARAIRALPGPAAQVPIIAMTASDVEEDIEATRQAGMNDFIAKPLRREVLQGQLDRWLKTSLCLSGTAQDPDRHGPVLDQLRQVPGLDAEQGLHTLHQDLSLYLHLIGLFLSNHGGDGRALSNLIAADQTDSARQLAHGLRGAAGNLGMPRIQALAAELEACCKQLRCAEGGRSLAEQLTDELAGLDAALRPLLPVAALPLTKGNAVDWQQARSILRQLEPLLASNDTQAQHLFHQTRELLLQALGTEAQRLERHLDDFDFDAALAVLQQNLEHFPPEAQP